MQTFNSLEDAIALAEFAHRHQKDKAGLSYVEHPKRVLATVQAQGAQPYVQIAAILHDVAEDTPFSTDVLLALGFSEAAVQLVGLLSRHKVPPDEAEAATERYYANIKANPDALMIKLADIADNLQAWRLSYLMPATQDRLRRKYARALEALNPSEVIETLGRIG